MIETDDGRAGEGGGPTTVHDRLLGLMQTLTSISSVALACVTNHTYYDFIGAPALPLLDFDLIAGTLGPAFAASGASGQPDADDVSQLYSNVSQLAGPHSIRNALEILPTFALPPGAMVELLKRRSRLRKAFSKNGRAVLQLLEHALQSEGPITSIDRGGVIKKLQDSVTTELSQFTAAHDDLHLLDEVLRRAQPLEPLLGPRPPQSDSVFRTAYQMLATRRSHRTLSNELDALNVAFVVWLFVSPKKTDGSQRSIPLLISQTRVVEEFNAVQDVLSLPTSQRLQVFNGRLYMSISSRLLSFSGGRNDLVVVKAGRLATESARLLESVRHAVDSLPDPAAASDELASCEWRRLEIQIAKYRSNFSSLLEPVWRFPRLDRVSQMNATFTPRFESLMSELRPGASDIDFRDRVKAARSAIYGAVEHDRDLFGLLSGENTITQINAAALDPNASFFSTSVVAGAARKTLLCEQSPGVPIESSRRLLEAASQDEVRFVCCGSPYFRSGQVVFVVDRLIRRSAICCALIWLHDSDITTLAAQSSIAAEELTEHTSEPCIVKMFSADSDVQESTPTEKLRDILAAWLTRANEIECFELHVRDFTLFADVEPLAGSELQCVAVAPLHKWTRRSVETICRLMAGTTSVGIPPEHTARKIRTIIGEMRTT